MSGASGETASGQLSAQDEYCGMIIPGETFS
jgi:hypothetical protein